MLQTPDSDLVVQFQAGDDIAFVALYNRYKRAVHRFCLKMLGDDDSAKDVVQGVFVKVYERRLQIRSPESFRSWLFTVARNDCLTSLRRSGERVGLNVAATDQLTIEHQYDDAAALVNTALALLAPVDREALLLREFENLSYREIAEVLSISESAVKSRLFAARRRIFEVLKPIMNERKE